MRSVSDATLTTPAVKASAAAEKEMRWRVDQRAGAAGQRWGRVCEATAGACLVRPTRAIAAGISAFRMNRSQTRPERRFSALSSVIPRSIPITSERLVYWVVIESHRRSSDLCTREMFSSS